VTLRICFLSTLPLLVLASCSKNDQHFLSIQELCPQRSEAICAARSFTCDDEQRDPACQQHEQELCEQELELLLTEEEREYYAPHAADVRNDEQAALDEGEPPFPLARYLELGLAPEEECARHSQCELGFCDPETGLCGEAPEILLCEPE
jgi:hypothetical protein